MTETIEVFIAALAALCILLTVLVYALERMTAKLEHRLRRIQAAIEPAGFAVAQAQAMLARLHEYLKDSECAR